MDIFGHFGIVKNDSFQPFSCLVPAFHLHHSACFTDEAEIAFGAFYRIILITGSFHCHQKALVRLLQHLTGTAQPIFSWNAVQLTVKLVFPTGVVIPDIAVIREMTALVQSNVPAKGLIINVVCESAHCLRVIDTALLDVVPAKIFLVRNVGVDIVAIQIEGQIDQTIDPAFRNIRAFQYRFVLFQLIRTQLFKAGGQIIELIKVFIFAKLSRYSIKVSIVICDEDLLIRHSEIIRMPNADAIQHSSHLFRRDRKADPLTDKLTLVILAKVRYECL